MRIPNSVIGILVVVVAALLLADGVLGYVGTVQLLGLRGVKLAVGFVTVVLAASYFQKTKE
jgi:general stress protein CsbA